MFVGVAEYVIRDVSAVEYLANKVVDEVDEFLAWQLIRLVEVDPVRENAVELRLICRSMAIIASFNAVPSSFLDLRATASQRHGSGTTKLCILGSRAFPRPRVALSVFGFPQGRRH